MTLEEMKTKIFESVGAASMCWDEIPHGVFDSTQATKVAEQILTICQEAIDEARLEEHKQTVLYWKTLPQNEKYGIDYHINRIKQLSSPTEGDKG